MINKVRKEFLKIIPKSYKNYYHQFILKCTIARIQRKQSCALKKLKGKDVINCVFFALHEESWKYDEIYRIMVKNPRFNPTILICPVVNYGRDNMIHGMDKCYKYFSERGYNVIKAYDKNNNSYIDAKTLNPDIIFYTTPYESQIDYRYYIKRFEEVLSVYVPYFINSNNDFQLSCNRELHNLVWRRYAETEFHRKLSQKYAENKGINVVTTGYPGVEHFLNAKTIDTIERKKKCIIWAPHHSIESRGLICYSCFLQYYNEMVDLAKKYSDAVHFVFKPHPLLRNKLYLKWGRKRTDAYYNNWASMDNTSLNEGTYETLFIESDAMIHDSASFIVEYLYLNKPVMRTLNGENLNRLFNEFGIECINNHYHAKNIQDIEAFIQNVIQGNDPMKEQRSRFIIEKLIPKGSPSQNVVNDILDSIDNQILYRK